MMRVRVGKFHGRAEFTLSANAGPYRRPGDTHADGQAAGLSRSRTARGGLLRAGDTVSYEFTIPEDLVPGSLAARIVVYPTPLANMTEALERLIQEPTAASSRPAPRPIRWSWPSSTSCRTRASIRADRAQRRDPGQGLRAADRLRVQERRLRVVRRRPRPRGADRLRPAGVHRHGPGAPRGPGDARSARGSGCWPSATARAAIARKTNTLHTWLAEPEVADSYNTWALLEAEWKADLTTEVAWVRDAAERTQEHLRHGPGRERAGAGRRARRRQASAGQAGRQAEPQTAR